MRSIRLIEYTDQDIVTINYFTLIWSDAAMSDFLNKIIQNASWEKTVLFTTLFAIFFIVMNGPLGAYFSDVTDGASILDFEFGFIYEVALNMLTAMGTEGRAFYLTIVLPLDFPFPVTYMLFGVGLISLLLKHITHKKSHKYLLLLPILAMFFDWIENIGIITMLISYPDLPEWAVFIGSTFGMLKWISSFGSIIATVILFIVFLTSKRRTL